MHWAKGRSRGVRLMLQVPWSGLTAHARDAHTYDVVRKLQQEHSRVIAGGVVSVSRASPYRSRIAGVVRAA